MTVRIPGFGQFVVEIKGVCDCDCTDNPVGKVLQMYIVICSISILDI